MVANAWVQAPLPKVNDRRFAEYLVHIGLYTSVNDIYIDVDPVRQDFTREKLKEYRASQIKQRRFSSWVSGPLPGIRLSTREGVKKEINDESKTSKKPRESLTTGDTWTNAPLPKLFDRALSEALVSEGVFRSLEDIYIEVEPDKIEHLNTQLREYRIHYISSNKYEWIKGPFPRKKTN